MSFWYSSLQTVVSMRKCAQNCIPLANVNCQIVCLIMMNIYALSQVESTRILFPHLLPASPQMLSNKPNYLKFIKWLQHNKHRQIFWLRCMFQITPIMWWCMCHHGRGDINQHFMLLWPTHLLNWTKNFSMCTVSNKMESPQDCSIKLYKTNETVLATKY